MASPPPPPPPDPTCVRCSKPITRGTSSQIAGRPIHMRCLARATQLESIEQQDRASVERLRTQAAMVRAEELMDAVRVSQTCAVCGERLGTSRGVLFQGDSLVHAACWRAEAASFTSSRPLPTSPEPRATILIV